MSAGSASARRSIAAAASLRRKLGDQLELRAAAPHAHRQPGPRRLPPDGSEPERVTRAIEQKGSLIAAIEAFNGGPRGLRRFDPRPGPTGMVFGTGIVDPDRPWEPLWFLSRKGA